MTTGPEPNPTPERQPAPQHWRAGLSLSGGGFRASAWGIGALLGVVRTAEADRQRRPDDSDIQITSIASVSGGSITNGAVATACKDLNRADSSELATTLGPLARLIADTGLIFPGRPTNGYLAGLAAIVALSVATTFVTIGAAIGYNKHWDWWTPILWSAVIVGGAILVFRLLASVRSLTMREPVALGRTVLYAVIGLVIGAVVGAGAMLTRVGGPGSPNWILIGLAIGTLIAWAISVRVFARRGRVVEHALERELFHDAYHQPLPLASLADRKVHHVFCATELQSGDLFYLSPRLAYGYQYGQTLTPGRWTVARAVQASAALPLAFPPQHSRLATYGITLTPPTWPLHPPVPQPATRRVVLADGGVYDNMGSEWDVGYDARLRRLPTLNSLQQPANLLVVANAGKALGWKTIWTSWRAWWELAGPLRDKSILYDQTTAPRRSALIRWFQAAEHGIQSARRGVIVQASTSPYDVAHAIANSHEPEKSARAAEWLPLLEARRTPDEWQHLADHNAAVKTVLHALGSTTTLDLIEHAAVLTQVQLHIHYDLGTPQLPDRELLATQLGIHEEG